MNTSRTQYAAKNFMWATIGNLSTAVLTLIQRTIFIYILGTTYLGVSGLFTNILGMLSLAELGFGSAISFSLYKPLADKDTKKVWAIIDLYKIIYRVVATVVTIIGLLIVPFLRIIAKGAEELDHLTFIYCIYLFNTVTSYLITYKSTVLNADQRNYLITNINTVVKIITVIVQTFVLILFQSFILYLIVESMIQLVSKFYLNYFTNKRYPYLREKNKEKLSKEDKDVIFNKVKALVVHKIGEVSIYQTDNIVTSMFINVNTVGLVSNFTLIINYVNKYVVSFFSASIAGLGNLNATESLDRKYTVFKKYDFLGFFFFSISSIMLYFLLPPFVEIWLGKERLIDNITVLLLCANFYFVGQRIPVGNMKDSAGVYEPDAWMSIVEAIINIIISVVGAIYLGLIGIYIGTVVSGLVPTFGKPYVLYKYVLEKSSRTYYEEYIKRICIMAINIFLIKVILNYTSCNNAMLNLLWIGIVSFVVPLGAILFLYRRSNEMVFVKNTIINIYKNIIRRF